MEYKDEIYDYKLKNKSLLQFFLSDLSVYANAKILVFTSYQYRDLNIENRDAVCECISFAVYTKLSLASVCKYI